jgi:hypothetical protein
LEIEMGAVRGSLRYAPRAALLLGGLAIAVWGTQIIRAGDHAMAGWALIGMAGATAPFLVRLIVAPPARLIIDQRGVFDGRFGSGWIPWSQIEGAHVRESRRRDDIYLKLRDPGAGRRRELRLDLSRTAASTVEVLELILFHSGQDGGVAPRR